jgi:hypothetical protein
MIKRHDIRPRRKRGAAAGPARSVSGDAVDDDNGAYDDLPELRTGLEKTTPNS